MKYIEQQGREGFVDKSIVMREITKILKPRVVCRVPKQRQSKVFREICKNAIDICSRYTKEQDRKSTTVLLAKVERESFEAGFFASKKYWIGIGHYQAGLFISTQSFWKRILWALNPYLMNAQIEKIGGVDGKKDSLRRGKAESNKENSV
ncbi:MAG: hypothetical protein KAJ18_08635 [Candidatus Omnitrophica bacterium]|nr:hypothetical protein [Candidatus Omnitrophota bacterium]